ncbi:MAG: FAD-dependent oxidoreductase [Deltaproteobacteria bacterium]|nr:MAG: FAD-dependent oxidoreductase [Deltaproteobacteria bacterium]
MKKWDFEADVVVVGSGGAGFTAAILAHEHGAKPVILERTDKVGGTTAISGGAVWIPMNSHMKELGAIDSREEALTYCKKLTAGRAADILVETFVDTGHRMVDFIEKNTPVAFAPMTMPDYHPEEEGAKRGGRSIEPQIYDLSQLGEWQDKVRSHPLFPFMGCVTSEELWHKYKVLLNAKNLPVELIMERMDKGLVVHGKALIGGLLKASLDRNIPILLETRGLGLIRENGRVIGVRAEKEGKDYLVRARGGVVLASGGFEWNEELKNKYLPGVITHPNTPPFNEGDGLIMAAEIGADLANMSEVWWMPSTHVPGDEFEGRPYSNLCIAERTAPHCILVNRQGRRFVNEAATYNEVVKPFFNVNENGTGYRNLPCWAISDSQYREKYTLMAVSPEDPDPDYFFKADTLEDLAKKIGVDANGLAETVSRFNRFAREGKDLDFGRGDSAYDRFAGDKTTPHPVLGTIEKPPFYAIPIYPGSLGTKGGPRTNKDAQVLDVRGRVIAGLYAAGNAAAGVSGPAYYGGGGVIGLAMTFGYLAGIHAAKEAKKQK